MTRAERRRVVVGRIAGVYGVRGWVKVISYTDPRPNIFEYGPWRLELGDADREVRIADGRTHNKGLVALLDGIDDRDAAAAWAGAEITVARDCLPDLEDAGHYWCDLIGLAVATVDGLDLGRVDHLIETGANDVLVVKGDRERLIPYLEGSVVREVDLERGMIRVEWDPDF